MSAPSRPFEMAAPDAAVCEDGFCELPPSDKEEAPVKGEQLAGDAGNSTPNGHQESKSAIPDQPQA